MKELKLNRARKQLILDNNHRILRDNISHAECLNLLYTNEIKQIEDLYIPEELYTFILTQSKDNDSYPFLFDNYNVTCIDYDKLLDEVSKKFPGKSIEIIIERGIQWLSYASNLVDYFSDTKTLRRILKYTGHRFYVVVGKKPFIENTFDDVIEKYNKIKFRENAVDIFTKMFLSVLSEKSKLINATVSSDNTSTQTDYTVHIPSNVLDKAITDFIDANIGNYLKSLNIGYHLSYDQYKGATLNLKFDEYIKKFNN